MDQVNYVYVDKYIINNNKINKLNNCFIHNNKLYEVIDNDYSFKIDNSKYYLCRIYKNMKSIYCYKINNDICLKSSFIGSYECKIIDSKIDTIKNLN